MRRDVDSKSRLQAKRRLLRMHFEAGVGHIGGNLSALDLLLLLYGETLGPEDAFVLSKGHAAGALYVALWWVGALSEAELETFHRDGTRLSAHPPCRGISPILFATGSLGHGPGLAAGLALAKRLQRAPGRIFCLTSDGEWNEGSCWESLIFAKHHGLSNLTLIVDVNGLQGFGTTAEVADLAPLADKFRAFGWQVREVDGHDLGEIRRALVNDPAVAAPTIILASTRKGCGISFMEGRMEWHYLPLTEPLYTQAIDELESAATQP